MSCPSAWIKYFLSIGYIMLLSSKNVYFWGCSREERIVREEKRPARFSLTFFVRDSSQLTFPGEVKWWALKWGGFFGDPKGNPKKPPHFSAKHFTEPGKVNWELSSTKIVKRKSSRALKRTNLMCSSRESISQNCAFLGIDKFLPQ